MLYEEFNKAINQAIQKALANTHTSLIAKVTAVNSTTIDCQPVINRVVDGESVELPVFSDVPLIHLMAGSSHIVMPIEVDDYVTLIVNERCLDDWYYGADNKEPRFSRMHDYSDSIALYGVKNKDSEIELPTDGKITIVGNIKHDGDYEQTGDYTIDGNITQTGDFNITGDYNQTGNMVIDGDLTVNGKITATGNITSSGGDIIAGTTSLKTHIHGNGNLGTNTTPPI
ncbi:Gp138 family membrane-puncturing spike protein [Francisella marina]|uniref:Phage protein Gp138 N-terminal domain-containing protein n=1 Tax=Francisella marina TaxID=2249302 RepID=A0ABX5ZH30_9GAMM|nr:Gp138 family membrane-puncturing spike protein [Francisella marina]QEO57555.1 hypothetical protein F0R74_06705 [Francisella marina]